MIQLQVLNKVLTDGNIMLLTNNKIDANYFSEYLDEYNFIYDHYMKYGNIPDDETMIEKFPEFEFLEVEESDQYLVQTIQEEYLYRASVPILNRSAELMQVDSNKAVNYLLENITKLQNRIVTNTGVDVMSEKGIQDRYENYQARRNSEIPETITTGLKEFDEILGGGWMVREELVLILGRINQGKSWMLEYFLSQAWQNKKSVLLYSGEMGHLSVGYRLDTLINHYSNSSLVHAKEIDEEAYEKDLQRLSEFKNPFIVVTPKDIGGRLTTKKLRELILKYNPDIVGIDQLSLMNGPGKDRQQIYTNIAEELYDMSEELEVPILIDHQANRSAAVKDEDGHMDTPEIEHSKDSDGPPASATRVISLAQTGEGLKLSIKKNRYGQNNQDVNYFWDIDKGRFEFLPDTGRRASKKDDTIKLKNNKKAKENKEKFSDGSEVF